MPPKASSSKRAASTREEHEIQLGSEIEDNDDTMDVRDQIRALAANQNADRLEAKNTQETLQEILESLAALRNSPASTSRSPSRPVHSTECDTPGSTDTITKHSKSVKLPDPQPLSDGIDPTFENWRIQIRGKLRVNHDHFPSEEAKMLYLFGRTTGDAQKHLQAKFEDDSPVRFTSVNEMLQHLAAIYVNPNKVRDARYDYGRLMMRSNQSFAEFQTQFLHLAGEGQVPLENYRLDLYDKLTVRLQEKIAVTLDDLPTHERLAARCLSLDSELRRIDARTDRQKKSRSDRKPVIAPTGAGTGKLAERTPTPKVGATALWRASPDRLRATPQTSIRRNTPIDPATATCFNCGKDGHFASSCPEPKDIGDIEEMEEEEASNESGKDEP
jgi:Zinc knuckle